MSGIVFGKLKSIRASLQQAFRLVWTDLARWGIATGGPVVRVVDHEGGVWRYRPPDSLVPSTKARKTKYVAHLLDPDLILRSTLRIPGGEHDLRRAAEWEVRAVSPFAFDATLWTWRELAPEPGGWRCLELFLTRESHAREWFEGRRGGDGGSATRELWAAPGVPFPGFGERLRQRSRRVRGWLTLVLTLSLLVLLLGALLRPVWQTRAHMQEAASHLRQLQEEVSAASGHRERLLRGVRQLESLRALLDATPDPIITLDRVTSVFPDSDFVRTFQQQGRRVQVQGQGDNTAQLLQSLREVPEFSAVRSPGAISRDTSTGRERFQIEFELRSGEADG